MKTSSFLKTCLHILAELYSQLYKDDTNWKGKDFKDYVQDALVKHLSDEDKYDEKKGPLEAAAHKATKRLLR